MSLTLYHELYSIIHITILRALSYYYCCLCVVQLLLFLQHCLAVQSEQTSSSSGTSVTAISSFRDGALMWPDCIAVGKFVADTLKQNVNVKGMFICRKSFDVSCLIRHLCLCNN